MQALRFVPVLGPLLGGSFIGFWIAAIVCSAVISKLASDAIDRRRLKNREEALAALDRFQRNHGDNPECSYRRGRVLKALGRKKEAAESFARVGQLARQSARFQQSNARSWAWRALLARLT